MFWKKIKLKDQVQEVHSILCMVHVFSGYRTLALCWQFEFSCRNERERVREKEEREKLGIITDQWPISSRPLLIDYRIANVYLCVIWPFSVNSDCKQGLRDWSDQCVRRQIDRYGYWSEGRSQSILNLFHQNTKPYRASVDLYLYNFCINWCSHEYKWYKCKFRIQHRIDRVWKGNSAKLS